MTSAYAAPSSIARAASTTPYRGVAYTTQQPRSNVTDDYERWYTEAASNNRMLLALRSCINSEVSWALDRLCRLCNNEQFLLKAIPGLTDALFDFPVFYLEHGVGPCERTAALFSLNPEWDKRRRHALDSLFILRNAAMNEPNAVELFQRRKTHALILWALLYIHPTSDYNMEFLLYIIELLQAMGSQTLPPVDAPPQTIPTIPIINIAGTTSNRALIVASLNALTTLLTNPANAAHLREDSLALDAAVRYLPLFKEDKILADAAVNYLYTHLSHPPMTKAFLLHPRMPATLRLLVSLLLHEQIEETVSVDLSGAVQTAPAYSVSVKDHELTKEELDRLVPTPEPQRCFDWMRAMFVAKPNSEVTQVDFWNLYKDTFSPYQERHVLLVASDVIKNVTLVFPLAQAMVLPGPPQRFIVRGVDRRKDRSAPEMFKCLWSRQECPAGPYGSTSELYEHILHEHISTHEGDKMPCSWASCEHQPIPKAHMRGHVLTHLPDSQPVPRDPSQATTITLPSPNFPHPTPNPTTRPPPPPRNSAIKYTRPVADPPSIALTALLCIRVLFRASFASSDAAPRVDEDHFGFPGIIEEIDEQESNAQKSAGTDREKEGERRGRKAFIGVRHMLDEVRIRDEALMGWITEMVDAGITGRHD
ncbi:hypothetical protein WOLCODRAFT_94546 [Wolfiporia cocos MD-104 SS10]|uniref:RFX-type winged-helix domain-containing protein n=1 Tax=Wolfiporia cocos (strain MD-104) TaxID=742152 RepID=A0A2H3J8J6_WOLCO|nr:hypothetical protein WOLCODRAFT_94546 [Wolfiporia cocos MD-104 SS10]